MKLLILTQIVDKNDPVLGFFHNWVAKLAPKFETVTVIGLKVGEHDLPSNVKVLSLGKETKASRVSYVLNFYKYIWQERKNYDAVFVHMNQEYVLLYVFLAIFWWPLFSKKVFMWRNHHAGNWLTKLAGWFCAKVFYTSKYSYTAKFKNAVQMPVGIDLDIFKPDQNIARIPRSILFLGRIAPSKNAHVFVEALKLLKDQSVDFTADIVGDVAEHDRDYANQITWPIKPGVPNSQTPAIYSAHELYVNLSSSGMYDKTIFEAMACGCLVLVSNLNLVDQINPQLVVSEQKTPEEVAAKIIHLLDLPEGERKALIERNEQIVKQHSLDFLVEKLQLEIMSA